MRILRESLWTLTSPEDINVYLGIPLSFSLTRMKLAIIDRGFADEIRVRFRGVERHVGKLFRHERNRHVRMLSIPLVFTFPIKTSYDDVEISDVLLSRSIRELRNLAIVLPECSFVLPALGIGYGKREWRDVREKLERAKMPDNVVVVRR